MRTTTKLARLLVGTLPLLLGATHAPPALALQFEPRAGLQALAAGATGIFEIGAADIGQVEVVLRALVHNGQVLQVHSLRDGKWLAKRSGSLGGKAIAPTALDELAHVAGGLDTDVRCRPSAVRTEFARVAGVVPPPPRADCGNRAQPPATSRARPAVPVANPGQTDCGAIGCRVVYRYAIATAAFQIEVDPERSIWGFTGYGIVAIWTIPEG